MKLSKSTLTTLILSGMFVSLSYLYLRPSADKSSTEEPSAEVSPRPSALPVSGIADEGDSAINVEEAGSDEPRFIDTGDGTIMLNIPNRAPGNSQWKTIEQLKSIFENLDEELDFTIERQSEEFRIVDLSDYKEFLSGLELDAATKENILAQLTDSNRTGFTKMLHHAVELQANGYVAWITGPNGNAEYFDSIAESSPAAVMGRNLDPVQLERFYDFEVSRQTQRPESPDYIAEFVRRLGL